MDSPTKIFAAYVVVTDLSTRRACGDKCSPTACGKPHQDLNADSHQVLADQGVPAFLFSGRKLRAQLVATGALVSVCSRAPLWRPQAQKAAFPTFPILPGSLLPLHQLLQPKRPLATPASSPANPSSLSPALCTLGLQPAVGVGESEALRRHGAAGLCTKNGDTGEHCFFGNFYLISLTKISLLFLSPQIYSW